MGQDNYRKDRLTDIVIYNASICIVLLYSILGYAVEFFDCTNDVILQIKRIFAYIKKCLAHAPQVFVSWSESIQHYSLLLYAQDHIFT